MSYSSTSTNLALRLWSADADQFDNADLVFNFGAIDTALADPGTGKVWGSDGAGHRAAVYPPGYQWNYKEKTSSITLAATTEGTATTVVTADSVTYDGAPVWIEFNASYVQTDASASQDTTLILYDDTAAASLGLIATFRPSAASVEKIPVSRRLKITPAAGARIYSIRGYSAGGSAVVFAGAGNAAATLWPASLRISKV